MQKQPVHNYFNFSRKERVGIITLLLLILLFALLPLFYSFFIKQKTVDAKQFEKDIASLKIKQQDSTTGFTRNNFDENNFQNYYQPSENNYNRYKTKGELFAFDPNTITAEEWKRLGVRDKTIITIQNYLSKGGHFYKPEDIGKIWGLHEDEIQRLMPYVQIAAKENAYNKYPDKAYELKTFDKPKYTPASIDINASDTNSFISLPGIGSKLSQRIIAFRDKLGGFYKVDQIGETFGLPDSTYQKIRSRLTITNAAIKQLNINTATLDELKAHPYIRFNIANAIIQYRSQHGNFTSVNDLKKIMIITEEVFNKFYPYLKTN